MQQQNSQFDSHLQEKQRIFKNLPCIQHFQFSFFDFSVQILERDCHFFTKFRRNEAQSKLESNNTPSRMIIHPSQSQHSMTSHPPSLILTLRGQRFPLVPSFRGTHTMLPALRAFTIIQCIHLYLYIPVKSSDPLQFCIHNFLLRVCLVEQKYFECVLVEDILCD